MRKLIAVEFVTLDGVMQGLGSPDEDREGGFEHGGWSAPYFDDVQAAAAVESVKSTTVYLFGRKTYEKMIGYWPSQPDENPMAAHLNAAPKSGGEGTVVVLGSGVLVQELIANDLVDGYHLFLHPLLLGTGKRLFREMDRPTRLRLVDCTPPSTGVLMLRYDALLS